MKVLTNVTLGLALVAGAAGCEERTPETLETEPTATAPTAEPAAEEEAQVPTMRELDRGPDQHVLYTPETVEWQDGPASFEPGSKYAVLEGDPAEDGLFTMQLRLPDGFVISPHTHPNVERVTVLTGTFLLGSGETVNAEAAERLPPGSYTAMPPGMVHHAIAEGETVVQLTSVGPWEIDYVDPADDPRKRDRQAQR